MTLYREHPPGAFSPWDGTARIGGVLYPLHIEQLWPVEDLAAIKLFTPAEAVPVPEGKVITGTKVRRVDGVVRFVHTLEDTPLPAIGDVVAERARRLAQGFDFDFGDERGVHRIGTTEEDEKGWGEVTQIALARVAMGNAAFISIVTENGPVDVEPAEWLDVLEAAAAFRQPIWAASFFIQSMSPIPRDFAADQYWVVE